MNVDDNSDFQGAGWPPDDDGMQAMTVPLFPLPNVFLFPGQVLPLHIFEQRYRDMVQDSLDRVGRLVIAPIVSSDDPSAERPDVLSLAGLGEIARFEKLPDGRFLIWLLGLTRVHIEEIEADTLYRQVRAEPFEEIVPTPDEAVSLRSELRDAISARSAVGDKLADQEDVRMLADVLVQLLELPVERMSELYCDESVASRARKALVEHGIRPLPE